ncbi:hypothetical protein L1049_001766 [Liquidambar formosana]|uniref:Uncharacterized protein n=1 Tax=Liquidambar formosana TaxID=63359 RepID=A0AAP0N524_LIQFO
MACSTKTNTRSHVRSISLPSRSHPSTLRIQEELNKLRTWEASSTSTAEAICIGLSGLEELYKCMDDLLNLPSTQQALTHHQHEDWVDELLDGSVRLLDICNITRDNMLQIKEHVLNLQSALRRRKGDMSTEGNIANYVCFRKKIKKDARKLIAALKQMDQKFGASPLLDTDYHLSSLIRVLREVSVINISIFQSLLLFLCVPVLKPKPTRWCLVSKLINKGVVACENKQENVNELESVDFALSALCRYNSGEVADLEKMQNVHLRLKAFGD